MGQVKALFYKYWILTKRTKGAFFCQAITPIMALAIIQLVLYLVNTIPAKQQMGNNSVIPGWVYPSNLIINKWQEEYSNAFSIDIPERVNRWGANSDEVKSTFMSWIHTMPNIYKYEFLNYRNQIDTYPLFNFAGVMKGKYFKLYDFKKIRGH